MKSMLGGRWPFCDDARAIIRDKVKGRRLSVMIIARILVEVQFFFGQTLWKLCFEFVKRSVHGFILIWEPCSILSFHI